MLVASLALVLGTAVLWVGGEQFVLGASRTAERTRIPTILIGLIVAGFGTSTPELAVSLNASARGEGALAFGNALGSNVANVLLVLPLAALVVVWVVRSELPRREVVAVLIATALVIGVAAGGIVGRAEGAILLVVFVIVMVWLARAALRSSSRVEVEREIEALVGPRAIRRPVRPELIRTLIGLGLVIVGADRLVWGASRIATELGVSQVAIGLTVVAVGTSLPEAVTSVVAARRNEPDLVLGNILGSNIFNALLIVGAAALVAPIEVVGTPNVIGLVGAGLAGLLVLPFLHPRFRITKAMAAGGIALYAAFVVLLYLVS